MDYLSLDYAIKLHDDIIDVSGGLSGIKDLGQLDSVLTHIRNDDYYPSFVDKLTHLLHSLIKFHVFNDGNKRTALLLSVHFMNFNHYTVYVDGFIQTMESVVIDVASGKIDKEELKIIIQGLLV